MRISALHVYPVKSLRGSSLPVAEVERQGLRHDRRWMVVDEAGDVLTARTVPVMLSVTAHAHDSGDLVLTTAGRDPLDVPVPYDGPALPVGLSRVATVLDAGREAARWLSEVLGLPARLVWLDDPLRRTVSGSHGGRVGDVLSLSDAGPLLLASTASLERLERWVADDHARPVVGRAATTGVRPPRLAMERFRPNLVVDGAAEPFVEDTWATVMAGDLELRVSELVDRCVMTTLDPTTQERGREPLRSLSKHRRWGGRVWFGVRLVPTTTGTVRVGDQLTATLRTPEAVEPQLAPRTSG